MNKLTIFTPTYNRANLLKKCYKSLINQNNKNFVWQIIDDGSQDDTEEVVESFIRQKLIEIEYVKKENGGKVSAINKSLEITKTEFWMCLDSDDSLFPNAVNILYGYFEELRNNPKLCGLIGLRCNSNGNYMQNKIFPKSANYATQYEVRYKMKIEPEYVQVYKTDIINKYKYPLSKGEKYMPLSYVPDQLDQKYYLKLIREPVMICNYQEEGITNNQKKIAIKNPEGFKIFTIQRMKINGNFLFKCRSCVTYIVMCIITKDKNIFYNCPLKALIFLCYPVALIDYYKRYKKFIK